MALVVHLHGVAEVVVLSILIVHIVHEGIEVALRCLVLIGERQIDVIKLIAETAGNAVGGIPVGVVGSRAVVGAVGAERTILEAVLIVGRRHVVVAQAEGHLGRGLQLGAQLQRRYAFQRLLGVAVHDVVARAVVVVVAIPVVIGVGDVAGVD